MPLTGPDILLYEKKDNIVYITINRPERRNSVSYELSHRIRDAVVQFNDDDDARVAIITGAGDKAFCTGLDLKEQAERTERGGPDITQLKNPPKLWDDVEVFKPIIAAINGFAVAGGWKLAQDCDIRIAAENAEFGISEVKVGRGAPWAISLLWMIPFSIALEILLTGQRITAQRAFEIGFVNKVVPNDQLMLEAKKMAELIRDNAPLSVRAAKEMLYRGRDMGCTAGLAMAKHLWQPVYTSEDCQEGSKAFAEKRKPTWKGR
jgi:enoyl-CoA hydratase/carnithine racemase